MVVKKALTRLKKGNLFSYSYIAIGYLSVLFNILLSLILLKKLSVSDFGKVSIGRTIFQSFEFSHIGIRYGMDRTLPATNDYEQKLSIFWTGLISTAFFSFLFVLFWSFFYLSSVIFYSFFICAGLLYALIQISRVYYRAESNKTTFVKISVYTLLLPPLCQIGCFILWGIWGLLASFFIIYLLLIILLAIKYKIPYSGWYKSLKGNFSSLMSQGLILFFTSLLYFLVSSGDRILVEKYWGTHAVGEYAFIMFIFSTMSIFPVNYTELFMSEIVKRRSLKYVLKHAAFLFAITTSICVISLIVLPYVLVYFLPQYMYLSHYMKVVVWAAIPYSVTSLFNYYLHAIDKRIYILLSSLISTFLYFLLLLAILVSGRDINYILIIKTGYFLVQMGLLLLFSIRVSRKQQLASHIS